jgi:hypothetical protein
MKASTASPELLNPTQAHACSTSSLWRYSQTLYSAGSLIGYIPLWGDRHENLQDVVSGMGELQFTIGLQELRSGITVLPKPKKRFSRKTPYRAEEQAVPEIMLLAFCLGLHAYPERQMQRLKWHIAPIALLENSQCLVFDDNPPPNLGEFARILELLPGMGATFRGETPSGFMIALGTNPRVIYLARVVALAYIAGTGCKFPLFS